MKAEASLPVVTFRAAGVRFALPARQVVAMRPLEDASSAAAAMEDLLGLPREASPACLLHLRIRDTEMTVQVSGEVAMRQLSASSIHPLPPLIAACSRLKGLSAVALDEAGMIILIEPARL